MKNATKNIIPVGIVIKKEKVNCWVSDFGGWGGSAGYAGVVKSVELWTLASGHRVSIFDRVSDNGLLDVTNLVRLSFTQTVDDPIQDGLVQIEGVNYVLPLEKMGAVYIEPSAKFGWGVDFSRNREQKSTVEQNRDKYPDLFNAQKFGQK